VARERKEAGEGRGKTQGEGRREMINYVIGWRKRKYYDNLTNVNTTITNMITN
jgi:hypothetical protein